MKSILFSSVILLLYSNLLFAQCPNGDVELMNQQAIDDFIIDYPNCTEIVGNLRVGNFNTPTDITNLNGLSNITSVSSLLQIANIQSENLEGLTGLEEVGWLFSITKNPNLINLQGLDNLSYLGNLDVIENNALVDFTGMESLTKIGRTFTIQNNDNLKNLKGLNGLVSIAETNNLGDGEFYVYKNSGLNDFEGLTSLTLINGSVLIRDNSSLSSMNGLNNLSTINSYLWIQECHELTSLEALSSLNKLANGRLQINDNDNITSLNGLHNITETTFVSIGGNNSLLDLKGLSSLAKITSEDLSINGNDGLISLDGLENLVEISRNIDITNNASLASIESLKGITSIGEYVKIHNNDSLTNLEGLNNLTEINTTYKFGGWFSISHNETLTDLSALSNFTTLHNGTLEIENNASLSSLNGLNNIDPESITTLKLISSNNLSYCSVESICSYLSNGGDNTIEGNATGCSSAEEIIDICNLPPTCDITCSEDISLEIPNGTEGIEVDYVVSFTCENEDYDGVELVLIEGLESGEIFPLGETTVTYVLDYNDEILDSCTFTVTITEEILSTIETEKTKLQFYPNPVKDVLTITGLENSSEIFIYDLSGKLVLKTKSTNDYHELDISHFNNGVYNVKVIGNEKTNSFKFVKN